eukprot:1642191-Rhodomonas_salina.3
MGAATKRVELNLVRAPSVRCYELCDALPGTDSAFGATRMGVTGLASESSSKLPISLHIRYAMSGTDVACSASTWWYLPVLMCRMLLPLGRIPPRHLCSCTLSPLPAYARAMQCPVLTSQRIVAGKCGRRRDGGSGRVHKRRYLMLSAYARAMRCLDQKADPEPKLRQDLGGSEPDMHCYGMSGIDEGYDATRKDDSKALMTALQDACRGTTVAYHAIPIKLCFAP